MLTSTHNIERIICKKDFISELLRPRALQKCATLYTYYDTGCTVMRKDFRIVPEIVLF